MIAARKKQRQLVVARGALFSINETGSPYARLADRSAASYVSALLLAVGVHAALGAAVVLQRRDSLATQASPPRRILAVLMRNAPPPSPPTPTPPPPRPLARGSPRAALRVPPAAPLPPAQAAKAIAVESPADLTAFDLVVGQGMTYAGGISAANGTNQTAVHEPAQIGAPPRRELATDRSRAAAPLRRDWVCPWPAAEQDSDLRDARVTARIHISRDGEASRVEIIAAPPGGFADAARRCAEGERYRPALDVAGSPAAAAPLFNVRFSR